jgi:L-asparaginase
MRPSASSPGLDLRVLVTGGTIDKTYSPIEGTLGFSRTNVLAMLAQARVALPESQVQIVLLKDSLDMTDADREGIRAAAAAAPETRLIITHGTDTMVLTARHLAQARLGKTIVLVGAMVPFAFGQSDGLFNLGLAFAAVQLLPPDVFIAMNGRVFRWDAVRKNQSAAVFESIPAAETAPS